MERFLLDTLKWLNDLRIPWYLKIRLIADIGNFVEPFSEHHSIQFNIVVNFIFAVELEPGTAHMLGSSSNLLGGHVNRR